LDYDLVSGLVGLGVYALERLPRPRARRALELIVDRLAELSETRPDGTTWHTPPHLLPAHELEMYPQGCHNLGLAHGMPGVIALLAGIRAHGVAPETTARLLEGALAWLWAQRLAETQDGLYSTVAERPHGGEVSRLAWCYGDAGIAGALSAAGHVLDHTRLREVALAVGRKAAQRDPARTGVVDAGLCHGSAGVAHVFNRLFQATREELFLAAARTWFTRTLELRREGAELGGYLAWSVVGPGFQFGWKADPGLLTGAAGVAAALLAATSSVAPTWDRFLLLSLPASGPTG
jgi:hypothetical protein